MNEEWTSAIEGALLLLRLLAAAVVLVAAVGAGVFFWQIALVMR